MARRRSESYEAGRFGIILSALLLILGAISWWRDAPTRAFALTVVATVALAFTLAARPLWIRFFRGWMWVVEKIGRAVTLTLLTGFFFLVLTPYGWILRLAGRRALDLAWKKPRSSYWVEKPAAETTAERYRRPF